MATAVQPVALKRTRSSTASSIINETPKKVPKVAEEETSNPSTVKPKCRYWEKCFRKSTVHLKSFRHPEKKAKTAKKAEKMDVSDSDTEEVETTTRSGRVSKPPPKHKSIPQVLLAQKYTESVDPKGWWLSEKLDGVRCYWDGKHFYSRLGNSFHAPDWFIEDLPSDMELDGELFGGRGKFQSTVSIVKSGPSDRWKNIKFQVFDAPGLKQPFEKRMKEISQSFEDHPSSYAEFLEHEVCRGREHIEKELKRLEGLGGEGLMIRMPKSMYVNSRSDTLLKIKTFHDAEAVVIGYVSSASHRVGSLQCRMECGKLFKVGSGLSNKDRRSPPKIGSIITYKFQELTNSGSPRFPSYIGIRIDLNEAKDAVLPDKPADD